MTVGPEWAAVNMAITLCQNCAGKFLSLTCLTECSVFVLVYTLQTDLYSKGKGKGKHGCV